MPCRCSQLTAALDLNCALNALTAAEGDMPSYENVAKTIIQVSIVWIHRYLLLLLPILSHSTPSSKQCAVTVISYGVQHLYNVEPTYCDCERAGAT